MIMDGRMDRYILIGPMQEWKYAHKGNLYGSKQYLNLLKQCGS
jgi:hypothetical protein